MAKWNNLPYNKEDRKETYSYNCKLNLSLICEKRQDVLIDLQTTPVGDNVNAIYF